MDGLVFVSLINIWAGDRILLTCAKSAVVPRLLQSCNHFNGGGIEAQQSEGYLCIRVPYLNTLDAIEK